MVSNQHSQDHITIPKEVLLSCTTLQARRKVIEENILLLIEDTIVGDASRIQQVTLAQIAPTTKSELELMAQVIVSKALDEPQHCKACVSLSGALQILLPALPSERQGKKGETFMHALLDVFQMEFEGVCTDPAEQTLSQKFSKEEEKNGPSIPSCASHLAARRETKAILAAQRNQHRIRAIVHLAGHLHCQGLLANGVVSQMVHDLVDNGEAEAANELLWFIRIVANNAEPHQQHLGTVLEDTGDSDGASSESISMKDLKERHPSRP